MKEMLIKRIGNLLTIKSIVTISLTFLFSVLAFKGVTNEQVNNVFLTVIAFYYGSKISQNEDK